MSTHQWLNRRIDEGETLLADLRAVSAGLARREEDADKPEIVQVRDYMNRFLNWDAGNTTCLRRTLGEAHPCVEQYSAIELVDRQLAITDFGSIKGRLKRSIIGRIDALRSILEIDPVAAAPQPEEANRVFIGHGRSAIWRELKDYVEQVLDLRHEEFEREPAYGVAITERLNAMLDACSFAIILMTAEDPHPDGSAHARENVIHEIGLFQGRLGMNRVLLLLEDGCEEFSNIKGIVHARFPTGRVRAAFEDVRRALERATATTLPRGAA